MVIESREKSGRQEEKLSNRSFDADALFFSTSSSFSSSSLSFSLVLLSCRRLSMSLYWLVSAVVAFKTGYFRILFNREALSLSSLPSVKLVFSSLLLTLAPQPFYFRAVSDRAAATRPGRRDWGAIATFTVVNSLLETAVFKWMVDLGAAAAAAATTTPPPPPTTMTTTTSRLSSFFFLLFSSSSPPLPPPSPSLRASSLASFLLLSAYCGLVHALFWDKCAFPPHRPPLVEAAKAKAKAEATATATAKAEATATAKEKAEAKAAATAKAPTSGSARSTRATRAAAEEGEEEELRRAKAIGQRSAMNTALLLFFPMTAAWHRLLLLASSGGDSGSSAAAAAAAALAAVVALHAVADFSAAFSLRLRGPLSG